MFGIISNSSEDLSPLSCQESLSTFYHVEHTVSQLAMDSTSHYEASNSVRTVKDVLLKIKATFVVAVQRQNRKSHLCPVLFIFPIHIQAVPPHFFILPSQI